MSTPVTPGLSPSLGGSQCVVGGLSPPRSVGVAWGLQGRGCGVTRRERRKEGNYRERLGVWTSKSVCPVVGSER